MTSTVLGYCPRRNQMGRRAKDSSGINKSAAIREILAQTPDLKVKDIVSQLGAKGITVGANHVYLVKGKMKGAKKQRMQTQRRASKAAFSAGNTDAVATILKVKSFANEI